MKTLIAVTGGVDSTYVLWKYLSTTQDKVTAIHFDTEYVDQRTYKIRNMWRPKASVIQKKSLNDIVPWLQQNVRSFEYVEHVTDPSKFSSMTIWPEYMGAYAVEHINNGTYDNFVTGHCKANEGYGAGSSAAGVVKQGHYVMWEQFKADATRGQITFPLFDVPYDRSVALTSLPSDLLNMVSLCDDQLWNHDTNSLEDCGHCTKCALKYFYNGQIASGKTSDQIMTYVNELSAGPNSSYIPQKYWLQAQVANTETYFVVPPRNFVENDDITQPWPQPIWPSSYKVGQ